MVMINCSRNNKNSKIKNVSNKDTIDVNTCSFKGTTLTGCELSLIISRILLIYMHTLRID